MRIAMFASEVVPFAKTGGLADVVGALPLPLERLRTDARPAPPLSPIAREGGFEMRPLLGYPENPLGDEQVTAEVLGAANAHGGSG